MILCLDPGFSNYGYSIFNSRGEVIDLERHNPVLFVRRLTPDKGDIMMGKCSDCRCWKS